MPEILVGRINFRGKAYLWIAERDLVRLLDLRGRADMRDLRAAMKRAGWSPRPTVRDDRRLT
jgi:hypothetical protein